MTKNIINPDLLAIEQLARKFADAHGALAGEADALETDIRDLKLRRMARLRAAARRTVAARGELVAAIAEHPELFKKPKTREFFGVRLGFMKRKGTIAFRDADALVAAIKKQLPDSAANLIQTKETPIKAALAQLSGAVLKRLGVSVQDDTDEPFVKVADGDVLKQVTAWLDSVEQGEG